MAAALKVALFSVDTEHGYADYVCIGKAKKTVMDVYFRSKYGLVECTQKYPACLQLVRAKIHRPPEPMSRRAIRREYGRVISEVEYRRLCKEAGESP